MIFRKIEQDNRFIIQQIVNEGRNTKYSLTKLSNEMPLKVLSNSAALILQDVGRVFMGTLPNMAKYIYRRITAIYE